MGKVILCKGNIATNPYCFEATGTRIYSIEELCYYIYENIYTISRDDLTLELPEWIRTELGMESLATNINHKAVNQYSFKDIVVTILCSCDYYVEDEIVALIRIIDQLTKMSPVERTKLTGDHFLSDGNYKEACQIYEQLLNGEEAEEMDSKFYGDIMHNLAIVHCHSRSYSESAEEFRQAYARNQKEESLRAYFLARLMDRKEEGLYAEAENYPNGTDILKSVVEELELKMIEAEESKPYEDLEHIWNYKKTGRVEDYYQEVNRFINRIRNEYRLSRQIEQ